VEVSCFGLPALVLVDRDLVDGQALMPAIVPLLVPPTSVAVIDLHGVSRIRPAAVHVLDELARRASCST
jgi:hypothetical protein